MPELPSKTDSLAPGGRSRRSDVLSVEVVPDDALLALMRGAGRAPAGEGRRLEQGQAAMDGLDGFFGGLPIAFAVFQVGLVQPVQVVQGFFREADPELHRAFFFAFCNFASSSARTVSAGT